MGIKYPFSPAAVEIHVTNDPGFIQQADQLFKRLGLPAATEILPQVIVRINGCISGPGHLGLRHHHFWLGKELLEVHFYAVTIRMPALRAAFRKSSGICPSVTIVWMAVSGASSTVASRPNLV